LPIEGFIVGTLGFAAMAAILYVWGYRKSRSTPRRLQAQMGQAIEERIKVLLAGQLHGATLKEIAKSISDLSVGGQLQGYKLQVEDARAASDAVLRQMISRGLVVKQDQGKTPKYLLTTIES
jgi:hypothetical protein